MEESSFYLYKTLEIQKYLNKIKPYEGSYAIMISNEGLIAGHPNQEYYTKNFAEIYPDIESAYKITEKIKKGESFDFLRTDESVRRQQSL